MSDTAGAAGAGEGAAKLPRHISPTQIRGATFERAPFGRRGFDEQEVQGYLDRLAEELALRDVAIQRLTNENRQLKHALREWHRQLVGYDAAELIARAQLQIESQISQAEAYSREREQEAAQRYDEIVAEAKQLAYEEAQKMLAEQGPPRSPVAESSPEDPEWFDRQQTYTLAVLRALDSLAAQVDASRQALTFEVGKLKDPGDSAPPPEPLQLAPAPKEPPLAALAEVRRPPETQPPPAPKPKPKAAKPKPKPEA